MKEIKIIEIFKKYSIEPHQDELTYEKLSRYLLQEINSFELAFKSREQNISSYNKSIYDNNIKEVDSVINHASALIQNRYAVHLMESLNDLICMAKAQKYFIESSFDPSTGKIPKPSRLNFCVSLIIAWKTIKRTESIPPRQLDTYRENKSEFFYFISDVLEVAGGHVRNTSPDELHKNILVIGEKMTKNDPDAIKVEWMDGV